MMLAAQIKHLIGQAIFVAFGFLAFVSLAGAAITIGELGTPGTDATKAIRLSFIAIGMSAVFFAAGYFARRVLSHPPSSQPHSPE
jgi:hypothetical protein